MADTFRITAYNAATDVATVVFALDARENFNAVASATVGISGVPKDTVQNVKDYLRAYVDAYITGKQEEARRAAVASPEVTALVNATTELPKKGV